MAVDIKLSQKAGELREAAHAEMEALKTQVEAQAGGAELPEGQTKLSPEEIEERAAGIEAKFAEAKSYERMNSLEGVIERLEADPTTVAPAVKHVLANAGLQIVGQEKDEPVFKSTSHFLRAFRAEMGDYEAHKLTDVERVKLQELRKGATRQDQGEEFAEKIFGEKAAQEAVEAKAALTGAAGGAALVPTVHMSELLRVMGESQEFASRARHVPMLRRTIDFPRLVQTDNTDTRPIYGFAAVQKIGEGVQKPERVPAFEQFTLTAVKYASYLEAGDELLAESIISTEPLLVELLTDSIAYEYDRDCMRGSGTGEPQGFIGSDAEWVQGRVAANDFQLGDIFGMEERFFGTGGIYLHHPSLIPDLYGLAASNLIVWNPDLATGVPGTLLGRPLVKTHKLPALGTKGDICLVDPSYYIAGDLQSITIASSREYQFRNDLTAWRAVFRAAGSPWPAGLFSMESSGSAMTWRVSPFIVLGDVVTS